MQRTSDLRGGRDGVRGGLRRRVDGRAGVVARRGRPGRAAGERARYFANKYDHAFTSTGRPPGTTVVDWVSRILKDERDITIASTPLEATEFQVEDIRWAYVFYESGLSINVLYPLNDPKKRAVGFKLSQGMDVPAELADRFKFARQRSKLAGGDPEASYFVIKGRVLGDPGSEAGPTRPSRRRSRLAQEVGVPVVAGVLLDEVAQHPAQGHVRAVLLANGQRREALRSLKRLGDDAVGHGDQARRARRTTDSGTPPAPRCTTSPGLRGPCRRAMRA